jgi:hypothetical protein
MAKRKGKSVSFDAMVKFFMHNGSIPTRKDVERLHARLDRIERLIVSGGTEKIRKHTGSKTSAKQPNVTASDVVLEVIRRYRNGVGFSDIQMQTGFGEKKLRNIIFRLNKLGRIKRKSRGIYIQS